VSTHHDGLNFHVFKILPASDCGPRITSENPAKPMIPIDQGGGGIPPKRTREFHFKTALATPPSEWSPKLFSAKIHRIRVRRDSREEDGRPREENFGAAKSPRLAKEARQGAPSVSDVDRVGAAFEGRPVSAFGG
jgi:hypothetical protein